MADATYQPKIYRKQGGNELVVASGGKIVLETGGAIVPNSGTQATAIASLTDSTTGTASDTLDDTTAGQKDDIASLAAKINAILAALRGAGIIAAA
jgi:hypothetical protein